MAHSLKYALRRMATVWLMGLLVLGGLLSWFWYGPTLESSLNPVLRGQTYNASVEAGVVTFDFRANKVRPCRLADLDWYVQTGERSAWVVVTREDGSPVGADVTYPTGWRSFGPFQVVLPLTHRDADTLYGVLYYDCHPGWLTYQMLGPVRLK